MESNTLDIPAILGSHPGFGFFSTVVDVPGKGRTRYWFSFGVAMELLHYKLQYRERFGPEPDWVDLCHPGHRLQLCRQAINAGQRLPDEKPAPGS